MLGRLSVRLFFSFLVYGFSSIILYNPVFAQTQKRDLVISPQIYLQKDMLQFKENHNSQNFGIGSSVHYYLGNQIAVGVLLRMRYWNFKAKTAVSYDRNWLELSVMPEIQYNLLKSRLTPFIKAQYGYLGYYWQKHDNPSIPKRQRTVGSFVLNDQLYGLGVSVGVSYSFRDKCALFMSFNAEPIENYKFSRTQVGIGCQLVVNRKK